MRSPYYFLYFCCLCSPLAYASESPKDDLEEVIVRVHPLHEGGAAQSLSIIDGDELAAKLQGSLGETVSGEPGIQSASFGAAVGRPVIHGLGAARIKTTEDRIDSLDVSVTSTDHAVTVEPFIANQISILKGASTLLYGSGAIGGVVDVETGRIPKTRPDSVGGRLELRAADNADAETAAVRLDGAAGQNFAWHLDGFSKQADDYEIPGFVESENFRALEADEGEAAEEEERDVLEGSFVDSQGGAFGLSYIGSDSLFGVSVSVIDGQYGLVGGHAEEHEHEEEHEEEDEHEEEEEGIGMIELEQTRIDFEAQLNNPLPGIEKLNFRLGINDYEHQEIEGSGEIGTLFENDAWEGRVELTHQKIAGFDGVFGLQLSDREFSAIGEEAFVEPVDTSTVGLFWVAERHYDYFDIEAGLRLETVEHKPSQANADDVDFSTVSASLGLIKNLGQAFTFSGLLDYSSRAPSIEELYSNGPHLATQTFEVGDLGLQEEKALALTLSAHYQLGALDITATLYRNDFDDFIYQQNTSEFDEGLPVLLYQQDDGVFTGLDLEAEIMLVNSSRGEFSMSLLFDTVDAEIDVAGNQNLPRIPATRFGVGLHWSSEAWDAEVNYLHVSAQNDVADFELASDSYDDLSLRINRRFMVAGNELDLFIHGRNLTDEEQRNHVSFVKDFAPAPGRRIELGLRLSF